MLTGAEIDHLITVALFKIVKIDFTIGLVIFDRASIGTKLEKMRYFVNARNIDEEIKAFKNLDSLLKPFIKLRNALAHGVLIGAHQDFVIFMLTADYTDNLGSFSNEAAGYKEADFCTASEHGRECVKLIKEIFDVQPLHEITQYKLLQEKPPTLKSQRKNSPPKRPPRPQSSRG
jgi:hypothetical protein